MPHFQIFGQEAIVFQKLPELVNRFLAAPDPVVLHYVLNPATPPPERPQGYDVEIKMEDTALKHKMTVTISTSKESGHALLKLDEEVSLHFMQRPGPCLICSFRSPFLHSHCIIRI